MGYKAIKAGGQYLFKTLKIDEDFENECILTNLLSSTDYSIKVQPFNEKGPGPQSDEVIAQTLKFGIFLTYNMQNGNRINHAAVSFVNTKRYNQNTGVDACRNENEFRFYSTGRFLHMKCIFFFFL